ncbi:unnamed protein product [Nesidiocoris tenuis]|uniref:Beta-ketoacyl synthase C-terminal domain-containing protein n=1 Tax=Nesidiocoris tenuis TaxID=355587 RepID=A0A6H5G513_9HEMI|nr:unnamed protein product [Nesidiocoris tenuis]
MVFVQKRKDARRLYASVVGTNTNSDGFKEKGISFPSGSMQKAMIEDVFRRVAVKPSEISYVEAHGTGTKVSFWKIAHSPVSESRRVLFQHSRFPGWRPGRAECHRRHFLQGTTIIAIAGRFGQVEPRPLRIGCWVHPDRQGRHSNGIRRHSRQPALRNSESEYSRSCERQSSGRVSPENL